MEVLFAVLADLSDYDRLLSAGTAAAKTPPTAPTGLERGGTLRAAARSSTASFADLAPTAVFATLLDEGRYHGSIRTMYRLLVSKHQTGERRKQRAHRVRLAGTLGDPTQ
jgi:putative transposase